MVSSVSSRPPLDGSLNGSGSGGGEEVLESRRSVVGSMGPKTMVACQGPSETGKDDVRNDFVGEAQIRRWRKRWGRLVGGHTSSDAETGDEVVDDGPDGSLELPLGGEETNDGERRGDGEDDERNPLDVVQESRPSHRGKHL
jgi:hypothetical protein